MMVRRRFARRTAYVLLVGVLLTIALFPAQAQQPTEWKPVTDPDHTFTAEMPGAAEYSEEAMTSPTGTAYKVQTYVVGLSSSVFMIKKAVYPADVDVSIPKNNLKAAIEGAAKEMKEQKWTSINWGERQGLVAVDVVGMRGEFELRSYWVMKGSHIFTLAYGGPPGTANTADVDRFVNSLQISK